MYTLEPQWAHLSASLHPLQAQLYSSFDSLVVAQLEVEVLVSVSEPAPPAPHRRNSHHPLAPQPPHERTKETPQWIGSSVEFLSHWYQRVLENQDSTLGR